ncbi:MAG: hypothetical protein KDB79_10640, partial [Acidobacteria bacterium]|nr:hypothetical protein [Acidobacteriota bacterium]
IKAGTITNNSVGSVKLDFDSQDLDLMGSQITLNSDPLTPTAPSLISPGTTILSGTVTPAQPIRLLVRSVGYGPRGAQKILEAVVQKNFFNGLSAPATLTLIGSTSAFHFDAGQSQNVTYSGNDVVSDVMIPPIGTSNGQNLNAVNANLSGSSNKADVIGTPADVSSEMPFWLQTSSNLDSILQSLKNVAKSSGRYYPSGTTPPNVGNNANATGITFAEGDLDLNGSGGGILIVTGNLTLRGNFDFNGLIIVTGSEGVVRKGGGNLLLKGNIVVAPYDPNNVAAGFSSPKYDISGGGVSTITYNSSSTGNGLTAISNFVLGVAEK